MAREIVTGVNTAVLRTPAAYVECVNEEVREIVREMQFAMKRANGVGLAAPQIGVPLRIFIAEVNKKSYVFVNPEIVRLSKDEEVFEEGCLSVPEMFGPVWRPKKVTVVGLDQYGKKIKIRAYGLLARIFQHEIDHLNGILFVDKAKELHEVRSSNK